MSAQPEALRLADALQAEFPGYEVVDVSAAELRRLHAENEAKDALLRQTVEAWDSNEIDTDPVAAVIEAIRQHLKGSTQ